jgi:hypothetical protein
MPVQAAPAEKPPATAISATLVRRPFEPRQADAYEYLRERRGQKSPSLALPSSKLRQLRAGSPSTDRRANLSSELGFSEDPPPEGA